MTLRAAGVESTSDDARNALGAVQGRAELRTELCGQAGQLSEVERVAEAVNQGNSVNHKRRGQSPDDHFFSVPPPPATVYQSRD